MSDAGPSIFPATPIGQTGASLSKLVLVYAGFWWRVLAWLIDLVILSLVSGVINRLTGWRYGHAFFGYSADHLNDNGGPVSNVAYHVGMSATPHWHWQGGWMNLVSLLLGLLYFTLLESSRWQATIGKQVCRLRVTDLSGRRIGLARALGRYLGKFVSAALALVGFMMAGWTIRKQALHDLMAGTLVTRLRVSNPVFTFNEPSA